MYAWFYEGSDLLAYPLVGMFIFIAVFVVMVARAFARSQRGPQERAAALPLDDDAAIVPHSSANPGVRHGHE